MAKPIRSRRCLITERSLLTATPVLGGRILGGLDPANITEVEMALHKVNRGRGLGFTLYGAVISVDTLKRVITIIVGGFTSVQTALMAWQGSAAPSTGAMNISAVCEVTADGRAAIIELLGAVADECTYQISRG